MIHVLLRSTHIAAGMVTLVAATVALCLAKGSPHHRTAGRVFVVSGRIVVVSALVASSWAVIDIDSFIGDLDRSDADQIKESFRLFMAVLGVLGLAATGDLETGLAGLRPQRPSPLRLVGAATMTGGAALLVFSLFSLRGDVGSMAWFGVAVGIIGVGDGRKVVLRDVTLEPLVAHLTGMIGAAAAFLAAFSVFGASRIVGVSLVEGDPLAVLPVLGAIAGGAALTKWWTQRALRLGPDQLRVAAEHTPDPVDLPPQS